MGNVLTGGCLCGSVRYKVAADAVGVDVCHCSDCQKWSGGPFISLSVRHLKLDGPTSWYRSSVMAERGFCTECGSTVAWRLRDGHHARIAAGSLDHPEAVPGVKAHLFADRKPDFYDFEDPAPRVTSAETLAVIEDVVRRKLSTRLRPKGPDLGGSCCPSAA